MTSAMRVVIVGNSAAALSALESFRRRDPASTVTLVSSEPGPAYSRVLLPYYVRGRIPLARVFIRDEAYYRRLSADTLFGFRIGALDVSARRLRLSNGRELDFDVLLLATGASPVKPPVAGVEGPGMYHLHSLADAVRLHSLLGLGSRVLVLGSGFVALQVAWAACVRGSAVTVYESAPRILPRVLDESAAGLLRGRIESHGVTVVTSVDTEAVERDRSGSIRVVARGTGPLTVDGVIVATGVRPNDGLVRDALTLDAPGVPVSATMETTLEGIFAAGDAVRGPTAGGGPEEIHALWPTAVEHGRIAGANMAGADLRYEGSLSMNVTEMFGVTVASMGRFVPESGDDVLDVPRLSAGAYLGIVRREGVPVGAMAIGGPDDAALLGRLRPYIRRGWRLGGVEELQGPHGRERVGCAS